MEKIDKIITLLEKKNLTDEEQKLLESFLNEDSELQEFYKTYKKLGRTFLASKHLTIDELADYVLIKHNLEPENADNLKNIPLFNVHLRYCDRCTEEVKFYEKEYSDIHNFMETQVSSTENEKIRSSSTVISPRINIRRFGFIGISALAVLFIALLVISNITNSKHYDLASLSDSSDMSISRGRTTDNFELSIKALEDRDYQSAIEYLKSDIKLNPNDKTIFYSYYILGLTHLETAEKNFLGFFTNFDKSSSEAAIINLSKCVKLNTSGNFNNVNLDAYFYMAKASLMLEDSKAAKNYFEIVVKEKGSKMNEAEQILKELK